MTFSLQYTPLYSSECRAYSGALQRLLRRLHCSRSSTLSRLIRPTSTSSLGQTRLRSTQAQTPAHTATPTPQRALLYVPGSNQKMLDKMLAPTSASAAATDSTVPDVITLDLEDSVRTEKKAEARRMVTRSVRVCSGTPPRDEC
jgi:hypothetical protein